MFYSESLEWTVSRLSLAVKCHLFCSVHVGIWRIFRGGLLILVESSLLWGFSLLLIIVSGVVSRRIKMMILSGNLVNMRYAAWGIGNLGFLGYAAWGMFFPQIWPLLGDNFLLVRGLIVRDFVSGDIIEYLDQFLRFCTLGELHLPIFFRFYSFRSL